MKQIFIFFTFLLAMPSMASAQSGLIIQGAIQDESGAPLPNGNYSLSFRLYETETGGVPVWSETQSAVPITGGLYSVSLGLATPLTAPFSNIYYLGVSLEGGDELVPRARLSPSPYAMSLRGEENMFPAAGSVGIGTLTPESGTELHLKSTGGSGRLLIEGDNGAVLRFKKGNNTANISFDGSKITIDNLNLILTGGLNIPSGTSIRYNGLAGWRLIDIDNFDTGVEGWGCVDAWTNNTAKTVQRFTPGTPFSQEYILRPNQDGNDVLKKKIDLTGIPHTRIKVVFTFHSFGDWETGTAPEYGWGAFASHLDPFVTGRFVVSWVAYRPFDSGLGTGYVDFTNSPFVNTDDANLTQEMTAQHISNEVWLMFGTNLNGPASSESYGISNIEIWVQ